MMQSIIILTELIMSQGHFESMIILDGSGLFQCFWTHEVLLS